MELESVTDKKENTEECKVIIVPEVEIARTLSENDLADVDCTRLDVVEPRPVEKSATGKDNAPVTAGVGGRMGKNGTEALAEGGPIEIEGTPVTREQFKDATGVAALAGNPEAQAQAEEAEEPGEDKNGEGR